MLLRSPLKRSRLKQCYCSNTPGKVNSSLRGLTAPSIRLWADLRRVLNAFNNNNNNNNKRTDETDVSLDAGLLFLISCVPCQQPSDL